MLRTAAGRCTGRRLLRMMDTVTPRPESADGADFAAIRALLEREGLPNVDLGTGPGAGFWVLRDSGRVIGAIGLETYGRSGLLRSLVVAPEARGTGLGRQLVEAVEDAARSRGLGRLVLLTETAERFFAGRGYTVIDRATAPDEVRASAEFRSLCPASAICMSKTLATAS
ncbi:MAG TPA: arsenic resistance N-acetyltransferase ArsN2 [Steroidobacteraceae bacterium]|nr:arsenic resistance N-acetyltransferase ArsN2 [Steroidobacteraceae bacterium]